jgi:hypothetical protein
MEEDAVMHGDGMAWNQPFAPKSKIKRAFPIITAGMTAGNDERTRHAMIRKLDRHAERKPSVCMAIIGELLTASL